MLTFVRIGISVVVGGMLLSLAGCTRPSAPAVEDLSGQHDVSRFALTSLKGTRNGDRLDVIAIFADTSNSISVNLEFKVGPQTHLESGTWVGLSGSGTVSERSATFLGGQAGPPSIGGKFDLSSPANRKLFRVTIPLQALHNPL